MNYHGLVQRLDLPAGRIPPRQLSPSRYRHRRHRLPDLRGGEMRWRRGVLGGLVSKYEQQYEDH